MPCVSDDCMLLTCGTGDARDELFFAAAGDRIFIAKTRQNGAISPERRLYRYPSKASRRSGVSVKQQHDLTLWNALQLSRLPIFPAYLTNSIMLHLVRPLLRLFALVWLALGMSVPVSAWTVHQSAHAVAKVALDVAHHHETDGSVAVHDEGESDSRDSGPDHMPSILLGAVALADAGIAITAPIVERAAFTIPPSRGVERYASDGLRRPPRLG